MSIKYNLPIVFVLFSWNFDECKLRYESCGSVHSQFHFSNCLFQLLVGLLVMVVCSRHCQQKICKNILSSRKYGRTLVAGRREARVPQVFHERSLRFLGPMSTMLYFKLIQILSSANNSVYGYCLFIDIYINQHCKLLTFSRNDMLCFYAPKSEYQVEMIWKISRVRMNHVGWVYDLGYTMEVKA